MTYTKQDFYDGKIGCRCETREEYDRLMRECEGEGKTWLSGKKATESFFGYMPGETITLGDPRAFGYLKRCKHNCGNCLRKDDGDCGHKNSIPFSALFPLDPWADFCAARCYLRVTKDEWPEFAKKCEAAGMIWDDGEKASEWTPFDHSSWDEYVIRITGKGDNHTGRLICEFRKDKPIHPFSAIARPEPKPQPYDGRGKHKVGDRFEVLTKEASDCYTDHCTFKAGEVVQLSEDDGTNCPWFKRVSDGATECSLWKRMKPIPAPPTDPEPKKPGITITVHSDMSAVMADIKAVNDALDKLATRIGKLVTP